MKPRYTDCILLHSFGPKHPLNVYCAKSDKNFLLPVYKMTLGSHTLGDSRELNFPLLLFHFGNADEQVCSFVAVQMQLGIINSTFHYCGRTIIHTRPSSDAT